MNEALSVWVGYRYAGSVRLIWFDPGSTTGVFRCAVDAEWLAGAGDGDWAALGAAVSRPRFAQIGRNGRRWHSLSNKPVPVPMLALNLDSVVGGVLDPYQRTELAIAYQCLQALSRWPDAAWGYEDFVPRSLNQSRDFLAPVRLFSMLTALELLQGDQRAPFVQSAAIAKQTATDERLKLAGLYRPGVPHGVDAARHALTFLRRARSSRELRAAAWPHIDWS